MTDDDGIQECEETREKRFPPSKANNHRRDDVTPFTCLLFSATMKFRPCIDLHNGQVKQIVGSTLSDSASEAPSTNFSTERPASDFAKMYQRDGLTGGHVIMLGPGNTEAVRLSD